MKTWNYKVKSIPHEIIKKLDSALGYVNGFVFNIDDAKSDSLTFNVRKRILNPLQIILYNKIKVNGKILKTDSENETNVEVSFSQHFLTILYVSVFFGFGLVALIYGLVSGATMYLLGGILLLVGIILWIDVKKRFKRDIQKYKTLISEILEL